MYPFLIYRFGQFLALVLPLRAAYSVAAFIARLQYLLSKRDRRIVFGNLRAVFPSEDEVNLHRMAKEVFVNFAKYLVDFFRFEKLDKKFLSEKIKVVGRDNLDDALKEGKGVIALSAHLGNWELGGLILSRFRHPMVAVVLKHQNKQINDFFTRRRSIGNLKPVEIGISLRNCYDTLKNNGLMAILGDRDFSNKGFAIEFFGRSTQVPKGPAVFSYRMGSCIVPSFMVRMEDDTFQFTLERPIFPDMNESEELQIKRLIKEYSSVIESYVRRYPSQWYMFKNVWNNNHEKYLRPDTII